MPDEYPHFSDFSEDQALDGDKIRLDEILNKEILILGFKIKNSTKKSGTLYVTIQFKLDGVNRISFTGSEVLMDQLKRYEEHLPFYAIIKKINRHYTFS